MPRPSNFCCLVSLVLVMIELGLILFIRYHEITMFDVSFISAVQVPFNTLRVEEVNSRQLELRTSGLTHEASMNGKGGWHH